MKNKLTAIILSAAMSSACLCACTESESTPPAQTTRSTTTTAAATSASSSKTVYKDEIDLTYFFEQVYSNGYAPQGTYEGTRVYDGGAGLFSS
ncbi:MAG: hypothetical protein II722_01990 [Ruminococcus sp.]|nr:hypothetical protein [Ruminococcus sp.]